VRRALGLAIHRGVLYAVGLEGPPATPTVASFGSGELRGDGAPTLTPHGDFRRSPPAELTAGVEAASTAATAKALSLVRALAQPSEGLAVVGVIVPRWPKVADLERRIARASYAEHADEHLLADAVLAGAEQLGVPVVAMTGAHVLQRAQTAFGLDRHALGLEAERAQPALGPRFSYHHRLTALAARVALAAAAADDGYRASSTS
jgi:hypothetical protein